MRYDKIGSAYGAYGGVIFQPDELKEVSAFLVDLEGIFNDKKSVKSKTKPSYPEIDKVIFNDDVTVVFWKDGSPKTIVRKSKSDKYDKEKAVMAAMLKKIFGNANYIEEIDKFIQ